MHYCFTKIYSFKGLFQEIGCCVKALVAGWVVHFLTFVLHLVVDYTSDSEIIDRLACRLS